MRATLTGILVFATLVALVSLYSFGLAVRDGQFWFALLFAGCFVGVSLLGVRAVRLAGEWR